MIPIQWKGGAWRLAIFEANGLKYTYPGTTVWYVSTKGSDSQTSNGGKLPSSPLLTVQAATQRASSGDLIYIEGGIYRPHFQSRTGSGIYDYGKELHFVGDISSPTIFDMSTSNLKEQHALSTRNPKTTFTNIIFDVKYRNEQSTNEDISLFSSTHIDGSQNAYTYATVRNCVFKTNKPTCMTTNAGLVEMWNCTFDVPGNFLSSSGYSSRYLLYNSVCNYKFRNEGQEKTACLSDCNYDSNYRITSAPGQWIDAGVGTDLDGSKSDLGIYGWSFSWEPTVAADLNSGIWIGGAYIDVPSRATIPSRNDVTSTIHVTTRLDIDSKVRILHRSNIMSAINIVERSLLKSLINIPPPYSNGKTDGWLHSRISIRENNTMTFTTQFKAWIHEDLNSSINVIHKDRTSLIARVGVRATNILSVKVHPRMDVMSSINVVYRNREVLSGRLGVRINREISGTVKFNHELSDLNSSMSVVAYHEHLSGRILVKYQNVLNFKTLIIGVKEADLKSTIEPRYRGNSDSKVSIRVKGPYIYDPDRNEYAKLFPGSIEVISAGVTELQSSIGIKMMTKMSGISDFIGVGDSEINASISVRRVLDLSGSIKVAPRNKMTSIVEIRPPQKVSDRVVTNKDAYVRESLSKFNFGQDPTLSLGYSDSRSERLRSLIGFDVTKLTNLQEGYALDEVKLKVNFTLGRPPRTKLTLYGVDGTWTELGVTWTNQPKIGDPITSTYTINTTEGYILFDITNYMRRVKEEGITDVSFYLNASDETESILTSFYSKEAGDKYAPSIEYKYFDEVIRSSGKGDLESEIFVYQLGSHDQPSVINVKGIVWEEIESSLLVQRPGDIDSTITVTRSTISATMDVIARDDSDIESQLSVRESSYFDIGGSIVPSKKVMPGNIYVANRLDVPSQFVVRVQDNSDIISWMTISTPDRLGSIYVVPYIDFKGSISVRQSDFNYIKGFIAVTRPQIKLQFEVLPRADLSAKVLIRGEEKAEVKSVILVSRPDTPSQIYVVPYEDTSGIIKVRRSTLEDFESIIAVSQPQFDGTVEVLNRDDLEGSITINRYDQSDILSQVAVSRPDVTSSIHPKIHQNLYSTVEIRQTDKSDLIVTSYVLHRSDIKGKFEVVGASMIESSIRVLSGYLTGRIAVPANDSDEIEGSIVVRQLESSDLKSSINTWQFRTLPSRIKSRRTDKKDLKSLVKVRRTVDKSLKSKIDIWKYKAIDSSLSVRLSDDSDLESWIYVLFSYERKGYINVPHRSDIESVLDVVYGDLSEITGQITPKLVGYNDLDTEMLVAYRINSDVKSRLRVAADNKMTAILDITEPPREITPVYSIKDAYVRSGSPTLNYGREASIPVGTSGSDLFRSLVGFDISQIPANHTIDKVEFMVYYASYKDKDVRVYEINNDWTELGVTWNNHQDSDVLCNPDNPKFRVDTQAGYIAFDVTQYVRDENFAQGNQFINFLLKAFDENESGYLSLMSRDSGRVPRLEFTHYNPDIWSYNRANIDSRINVMQVSDINSSLTVMAYEGQKDVKSTINVLPPLDHISYIDTKLAISRPDIEGSMIVVRHENEDLESIVAIRESQVNDLQSTLVISQLSLGSNIVVPWNKDTKGTMIVRVNTHSDIMTWINVTAKERPSRIEVPFRDDIESSIHVNGYQDDNLDSVIAVTRSTLDGQLVVIVTEDSDIESTISVKREENHDVQSKIKVVHGASRILLGKIKVISYLVDGSHDINSQLIVGNVDSNLESNISISLPSLVSDIEVRRSEGSSVDSNIAVNSPQIVGTIYVRPYEDLNGTIDVYANTDISSELVISNPFITGILNVAEVLDMPSQLDVVYVTKKYLKSSLVIPRRIEIPSEIDVYAHSSVESIIRVISGNLGSTLSVRRSDYNDLESKMDIILRYASEVPSTIEVLKYRDHIPSRIGVRFKSPMDGKVKVIGQGDADLVSILRPVVFHYIPSILSIRMDNKMTGISDFIPVGDEDITSVIEVSPTSDIEGSITVSHTEMTQIPAQMTIRVDGYSQIDSDIFIMYRGIEDLDVTIRVPYTNKMTGLIEEITILGTEEPEVTDTIIELTGSSTQVDEAIVEERTFIGGRRYFEEWTTETQVNINLNSCDSSEGSKSNAIVEIRVSDSAQSTETVARKEFESVDEATTTDVFITVNLDRCDDAVSSSHVSDINVLVSDSGVGEDFAPLRGVMFFDEAQGTDCSTLNVTTCDTVSVQTECPQIVINRSDSGVGTDLFKWDMYLSDKSESVEVPVISSKFCEFVIVDEVPVIDLTNLCDSGQGYDSVPVREFILPESGETEHHVVDIYLPIFYEILVEEIPVISLSKCDDGEGTDWVPVREFITPDSGEGTDILDELLIDIKYVIEVDDHVDNIHLIDIQDEGEGKDFVAKREFITPDYGKGTDNVVDIMIPVIEYSEVVYSVVIDLSSKDQATSIECVTPEVVVKDTASSIENVVTISVVDILDSDSLGQDCITLEVDTCDSGSGIDDIVELMVKVKDESQSVSSVIITLDECDSGEAIDDVVSIEVQSCDTAVGKDIISERGVLVKDKSTAVETSVIHLIDIIDDIELHDRVAHIEIPVSDSGKGIEVISERGVLVREEFASDEDETIMLPVADTVTESSKVIHIELPVVDEGEGKDEIKEKEVMVRDSGESSEHVESIKLINISDSGQGVDKVDQVDLSSCDSGVGNDNIIERMVFVRDSVIGIETSVLHLINNVDVITSTECISIGINQVDSGKGIDSIVERGVVVIDKGIAVESNVISLPIIENIELKDYASIHLSSCDDGEGHDLVTSKEVAVRDSGVISESHKIDLSIAENLTSIENIVIELDKCDSGVGKDLLLLRNVIVKDSGKADDHIVLLELPLSDKAKVKESIVVHLFSSDSGTGTDRVAKREFKTSDSGQSCESDLVFSYDYKGTKVSYPGESGTPKDVNAPKVLDMKCSASPVIINLHASSCSGLVRDWSIFNDKSSEVSRAKDLYDTLAKNTQGNILDYKAITVADCEIKVKDGIKNIEVKVHDEGQSKEVITYFNRTIKDFGKVDSNVVIELVDIKDKGTSKEKPTIHLINHKDSGTIGIESVIIDRYFTVTDEAGSCEAILMKGETNTEVRELLYEGDEGHPKDIIIGPDIDGIPALYTSPMAAFPQMDWYNGGFLDYSNPKYNTKEYYRYIGMLSGKFTMYAAVQGGSGYVEVIIDDKVVVKQYLDSDTLNLKNVYFDFEYDGLKNFQGGVKIRIVGEKLHNWQGAKYDVKFTAVPPPDSKPLGYPDVPDKMSRNPDYPGPHFLNKYRFDILSNSINCGDDPSVIDIYASSCNPKIRDYKWSVLDDPDYIRFKGLYIALASEETSSVVNRKYTITSDCGTEVACPTTSMTLKDKGTLGTERAQLEKHLFLSDESEVCEAIFAYGQYNTEERDLSYPGEENHPHKLVLNEEYEGISPIMDAKLGNGWDAGQNVRGNGTYSKYLGYWRGIVSFDVISMPEKPGENSSCVIEIYVDGKQIAGGTAHTSSQTTISFFYDGAKYYSGGFEVRYRALGTGIFAGIVTEGEYLEGWDQFPPGTTWNPDYPFDVLVDAFRKDVYPQGQYCGDFSQIYLYVNTCKPYLNDYTWSMLDDEDYKRIKVLYENTAKDRPYIKFIHKNHTLAADCGEGFDERTESGLLVCETGIIKEIAILDKDVHVGEVLVGNDCLTVNMHKCDSSIESEDKSEVGFILCDSGTGFDWISRKEFVVIETVTGKDCETINIASCDTSKETDDTVRYIELYPSPEIGVGKDIQLRGLEIIVKDQGTGTDCSEINVQGKDEIKIDKDAEKVIQIDLTQCDSAVGRDILLYKEIPVKEVGVTTQCIQIELASCDNVVMDDLLEETVLSIEIPTCELVIVDDHVHDKSSFHYDEATSCEYSLIHKFTHPTKEEEVEGEEIYYPGEYIEVIDPDQPKYIPIEDYDLIAVDKWHKFTEIDRDGKLFYLDPKYHGEVVIDYNHNGEGYQQLVIERLNGRTGNAIEYHLTGFIPEQSGKVKFFYSGPDGDGSPFFRVRLEYSGSGPRPLADWDVRINRAPMSYEYIEATPTGYVPNEKYYLERRKQYSLTQANRSCPSEPFVIEIYAHSDCGIKDHEFAVFYNGDPDLGRIEQMYKEIYVEDTETTVQFRYMSVIDCGQVDDHMVQIDLCVCDWGTDPKDPGPPILYCCGRKVPGHIEHPPYKPGDPGYPDWTGKDEIIYPGDPDYPGRPLYPGDNGYPLEPGDGGYGEPVYPPSDGGPGGKGPGGEGYPGKGTNPPDGDGYPPILEPGDPGYPIDPEDPDYGKPVYPGDPDYPKDPEDPTTNPGTEIGLPTPEIGVAKDCIKIEQFWCDKVVSDDYIKVKRVPYHIDNTIMVDPFKWRDLSDFKWRIEEPEFQFRPLELKVRVIEPKFKFNLLEFKFRETPIEFSFETKCALKACPLDIFEIRELPPVKIHVTERPINMKCVEVEEE